jgi:hypothetical protein
MSNSRNLSTYGEYALPTDTTKTYTFTPGTGWVVAAGGGAPPYMSVREEQPSGTYPGALVVGPQSRVLNTVVANTIPGASLSGNSVTLPAGTYHVSGRATSLYPKPDKVWLQTSAGTKIVIGGATLTNESSSVRSVGDLFVNGSFVLSVATTFSFIHYVTTTVSSVAMGGYPGVVTGVIEVYTTLEIWKDA